MAIAVVIAGAVAMGQEKAQPKAGARESGAARPKSVEEIQPYLGVAVEVLHPSFWSHLHDVLEHKEGILVVSVAPGSPAEKAGVQPHDILTRYADQRLYSPDQLMQLVRSDKVGDQVALGILRKGKPQEITVTLGEHAMPLVQREAAHPMWRIPWDRTHREGPAERTSGWESFDSMTLKNLGDNRFSVDVKYLDKNGKLQHRAFEGTREEIHKDIQAQKDLPELERDQLLRSLDLRGSEFPDDFPSVYYTPDGRMILEVPSFNGASLPGDL
jgi:hypothetical protein